MRVKTQRAAPPQKLRDKTTGKLLDRTLRTCYNKDRINMNISS